MRKCDIARGTGDWCTELQWLTNKCKGRALISIVLKQAWNAFCYNIWKERNGRIYGGPSHSPEAVLAFIADAIRLRLFGLKNVSSGLTAFGIELHKTIHPKKRDAEAVSRAVRSLRKEARSWFSEKGNGVDPETEDAYAKASAWYHVTYHPDFWGQYNEGMNRDHFLSFPWCVYDKLIRIKKERVLESDFARGLHL